MITVTVAFLLSLASAMCLTPLVRNAAVRFNVLDQARSSRKIHAQPIPRLGGVAIVLSFYVPLTGLLFFESGTGAQFLERPQSVVAIFVGGALIALLGVYDDVRGSGAGKKFFVQFAVAGLMYALGFRVDEITSPFGMSLSLGPFGLLFTMFWIVGVINAMNLIDGLDGLASGVALAAVGTVLAISYAQGNTLMMLFVAALAGAILGFLFYNFNPATIFMGDTGSMFLGFILATSSIQTSQKSTTAVAIFTPIVALGLPILDTLLALARRAVRGRPLFSADREHIHHRLLSHGFSQKQAAILLYVACIALNVTAIGLAFANGEQTAVVLVALAGIIYLVMRRLGYLQFSRTHFLSDQRRRNRILRDEVKITVEQLRTAEAESDVWESIKQFAPIVGAHAVCLSTKESKDGEEWKTLRAIVDDTFDELAAFGWTFPVPNSRYAETIIEFTWCDGRAEVDRDEEIALENLMEAIGEALDRTAPGVRRGIVADATDRFLRSEMVPPSIKDRIENRRSKTSR